MRISAISGAIEAFAAQLGGARRQLRIGAERRKARHRTRHFVRRPASAMPMAFDANPFRAPHDLDQDPFEQQARDGLALGSRRGLGSPDRRQVVRQLADRREFGRARRLGLVALQPFVFRLEPRLFGQSRLPGAFERARHQPVLRLHGRVLPARAFDLITRALQLLTPMTIQRRALGFEIFNERRTRLDRRGRHRFENETCDQIIQRQSLQRLTERIAVAALHRLADVARRMAVVVVLGEHAQAAATADEQAGEKGRSRPRRAAPCGSVGLQLRLVAPIALEADVGRQTIVQEDFRLARARRSTSRSRPPGLLTPFVHGAHAVGVDARVDRIGEQVQQRRAIDAPPFEIAFLRPASQAHRHADLVFDQIGHHLADRLVAIEQIEHEADRRLRLFVGVERHFARGTAHVAHRHGLAQFAPSRLGFPAREHPRLQDMQFGFRHRPFQAQQQTIVVIGRIIHPIGIGDQRIEQRADFQKLMPIAAGARQSRHLDAEHKADIAEANFGDQPLKA